MKKHLYIFLLFLFLTTSICAQVDSVYYGARPNKEKNKPREKPPINWKENLSFGGNFMLWFGSSAYIYLSPTVNYAASKRLNLGLGVIYNYSSSGPYGAPYVVYGPYGYALFYLTTNFYLKAQYDQLLQPNFNPYHSNEKVWVGYTLLGGGFRQPLGDHAALFTNIMFYVNQVTNPVYINPIIQVGILAGF